MSNRNYGRLAVAVIAVWFIFALSASTAHVFQTGLNTPPLALGLAAVIPILVFWAWFNVRWVPRFCAVTGLACIDDRTVVANGRIRFRGTVRVRDSAWHVRIAGRMGRHCHRSDCTVGGFSSCAAP
jgi:hypothetical protein